MDNEYCLFVNKVLSTEKGILVSSGKKIVTWDVLQRFCVVRDVC